MGESLGDVTLSTEVKQNVDLRQGDPINFSLEVIQHHILYPPIIESDLSESFIPYQVVDTGPFLTVITSDPFLIFKIFPFLYEYGFNGGIDENSKNKALIYKELDVPVGRGKVGFFNLEFPKFVGQTYFMDIIITAPNIFFTWTDKDDVPHSSIRNPQHIDNKKYYQLLRENTLNFLLSIKKPNKIIRPDFSSQASPKTEP